MNYQHASTNKEELAPHNVLYCVVVISNLSEALLSAHYIQQLKAQFIKLHVFKSPECHNTLCTCSI